MLNILVALKCEGRPLRQHLALQRVPGSAPLPLYRGGDLQLVVSGVGCQAAARAVEYLSGSIETANQGWLNVGVAGHASAAVGTALVAHEVIDATTGERWHIPAPSIPGCRPASVRTVARPESRYLEDCAYDMEAAGFVQAARRVAPPSLVQCLKVVSDNRSDPTSRHGDGSVPALSARAVEALIGRHVDAIEALLGQLRSCQCADGLQDRR